MSPIYLGRLFKSNTGVNFTDFVNDCRIEHAAELLINTELKITSICNDVGYKDINYFIKVFRRKKGMTPSEYRSRQLVK